MLPPSQTQIRNPGREVPRLSRSLSKIVKRWRSQIRFFQRGRRIPTWCSWSRTISRLGARTLTCNRMRFLASLESSGTPCLIRKSSPTESRPRRTRSDTRGSWRSSSSKAISLSRTAPRASTTPSLPTSALLHTATPKSQRVPLLQWRPQSLPKRSPPSCRTSNLQMQIRRWPLRAQSAPRLKDRNPMGRIRSSNLRRVFTPWARTLRRSKGETEFIYFFFKLWNFKRVNMQAEFKIFDNTPTKPLLLFICQI